MTDESIGKRRYPEIHKRYYKINIQRRGSARKYACETYREEVEEVKEEKEEEEEGGKETTSLRMRFAAASALSGHANSQK